MFRSQKTEAAQRETTNVLLETVKKRAYVVRRKSVTPSSTKYLEVRKMPSKNSTLPTQISKFTPKLKKRSQYFHVELT